MVVCIWADAVAESDVRGEAVIRGLLLCAMSAMMPLVMSIARAQETVSPRVIAPPTPGAALTSSQAAEATLMPLPVTPQPAPPLPPAPASRASIPQPSEAIARDFVIDYPELKKYPKGSITSREVADAAILEIDAARARAAGYRTDAEVVCRTQYLFTSCMNRARDRHRFASEALNRVRIEARDWLRHDDERIRVAKRTDRQMEAKAKTPEIDAKLRDTTESYRTKLSKHQFKEDKELTNSLHREASGQKYRRKQDEKSYARIEKEINYAAEYQSRQDSVKGLADKIANNAQDNKEREEKLAEKIKKRTDDAARVRTSVAEAPPKPLPKRPPPLTLADKMVPMPQ